VTAEYAIRIISLSTFSLPPNAVSTNVIATTVRYKHVVEVPQTNGAVKFELLS
jgi:hypothetical protein